MNRIVREILWFSGFFVLPFFIMFAVLTALGTSDVIKKSFYFAVFIYILPVGLYRCAVWAIKTFKED